MRRARMEDLEAAHKMGIECFPAESWTLEGLAAELEREFAQFDVAELEGGGIIGYIIAWCVTDEVHLLQVATTPEWRRRGVANCLLDKVIESSKASGARVVFLEVRASNEAAQALYRARGFSMLGVRRGYYEQPREDAVVMASTLCPQSA